MKNVIDKTLVSSAGLEAVMLRVPIGIILAAHGSQKLFAWFGGYGLEGTGQWMASVGLNPGLSWRYWRAALNFLAVSR